MLSEPTQCGYVALVGRPNVGKSTLLNYVLGQKISITSRKPQTTRRNLIGVDTQDGSQAIYVDTPGIHQQTERELNRYMVNHATSAIADVDLVVVIIEGGNQGEADGHVLDLVASHDVPKFAVLSKVDLLKDKTQRQFLKSEVYMAFFAKNIKNKIRLNGLLLSLIHHL